MRAVFSIVARLCRGITMLALFALIAVTAVDVTGRVLFNSPLGFAYELIGVLLGVAVFAGLVDANWRRDHIRIDLADGILARIPKVGAVLDRFVWLLELVFTVLLAGLMARQAITLKGYQEQFLFLPVMKWVPVTLFSGFVIISIGAFAAHLFASSTHRVGGQG